MPSTPLRDAAGTRSGRPIDLGSTEIDYADGSEEAVLEHVRAATDLASLGNELEAMAGTWAERYHLSRSRANVVRALCLPEEAVVLEVGAGCGAITRHLGETCCIVDAVEPVRARAVVAAERTRDQANVEVFAGTVDDIPPRPAYDCILLVGVLEYVAAGSADESGYISFLEALRSRLLPGGRIVCAIENQLGVKYLSGAVEDHSGCAFEGVEGYPAGGPARTFSRTQLAAIFEHAGLHPRFLHAFPDYKLTRVVFSDALVSDTSTRDLAWRIPLMPSPDWEIPRPRVASEGHLWRSLVEAGLGAEFANSFLVVAGSDEMQPLWPDTRLATFFNTQRRAEFATRTDVIAPHAGDGSPVRFLRRIIGTAARTAVVDDVHLEVTDADLAPGRDLLDILAGATDEALASAAAHWRDFATDAQDGDPLVHADLVPHNIVVSADGDWQPIDQEWKIANADLDWLLARGAFWLGVELAPITPPERWPDGWAVRDLVIQMGKWVGLDPSGAWLEDFLDREARLQATIRTPESRESPAFDAAVARSRTDHVDLLERPLAALPLGRREHDVRAALERQLCEHDHMLWTARQQLDEVGRLAHQRGTELAEMHEMLANSRAWKLANRLDRVLHRLGSG